MKTMATLLAFLLALTAGTALYGDGNPAGDGIHDPADPNRGVQGYAGPGWWVLFGPGGEGEMASLGPLMFRVSESTYVGALLAYEESASEGPGTFLGGARLEAYPGRLSRGFYSTSAALSVLAGAAGLNGSPRFAAQIDAELAANFLLFPSVRLSAGPLASLRLESGQDPAFLPGLTFSLKEGVWDDGRPLVRFGEDGPRVGGYWQGLWTWVDGRAVFVDGGGTRIELPSGLAFGITGGVLRQKIERSGSSLAIMLSGMTAGWNWRAAPRLTVAPRVTTGVALYGWAAPDGTVDGGPHFMIRPEVSALVGVLPFLEIGGGVGWHVVAGEADTAIPLERLSSISLSVQVRAGHR